MSELLLTDVRVLVADGEPDAWIHVVDGHIEATGTGTPPATGDDATVLSLPGHTVAPGFIDVHVHGALGHETMDADPVGLRAMARYFATRGVTSFLATTWTETRERTLTALEAVADTLGPVDGGAEILGAHLEGPYLTEGRCGAQDPAHIRMADPDELDAFLATGAARLMTIAPEFEENVRAIRRCVDAGVTASIGHTDARAHDVMTAADAGASHATHLFNAMRPLHHREPGTVGAILTEPRIRAEVICDLIHIHPEVLRLAMLAKTPAGLVVMTDAVGPTGLDDGAHRIGGRTVLHERGAVWLEDGTTLAGSALNFDVAVRNLVGATGVGIEQLWPACSRNGAQAAGVADRKGHIAPRMDADLVVLDADLQVEATIVGGDVVYRRHRDS